MNRPVTALRPKLFITIETELWPVLFRKLEETGSQIIILNGRLSGKSFRGYRLVKSFMESVFAPVKFFCMQGKEDVRRIVQLGADPQKVRITGNFKYDVSFDLTGSTAEWLDRAAGKILVAGSTHRGEEEIILAAYRKITGTKGKVHLILAPRHPERFSDVEEILQKEHFSYIRRTAIEESSGGSLPDVVLLDSIGELSEVYARADIAFVGGSLKPLGGHNILEPAYWGRPVLFGPHMDNFPMASDFKMAQAGIEVRDEEAIVLAVNDLLGNREKAEGMGQRAQRLVKENSGAVEKALHLVRDILGTP